MKTNELMIGDWVYNTHNKQNEKVVEVGSNCVLLAYNDLYAFDEIEPIPLEKIHLVKNGFDVRYDTDDMEFFYNDGYEVTVIFDEGFPEEDIPPSIFLNIDFAEKRVVMPIEYVHQLQQAMRLMGCDKEIEL